MADKYRTLLELVDGNKPVTVRLKRGFTIYRTHTYEYTFTPLQLLRNEVEYLPDLVYDENFWNDPDETIDDAVSDQLDEVWGNENWQQQEDEYDNSADDDWEIVGSDDEAYDWSFTKNPAWRNTAQAILNEVAAHQTLGELV